VAGDVVVPLLECVAGQAAVGERRRAVRVVCWVVEAHAGACGEVLLRAAKGQGGGGRAGQLAAWLVLGKLLGGRGGGGPGGRRGCGRGGRGSRAQ